MENRRIKSGCGIRRGQWEVGGGGRRIPTATWKSQWKHLPSIPFLPAGKSDVGDLAAILESPNSQSPASPGGAFLWASTMGGQWY